MGKMRLFLISILLIQLELVKGPLVGISRKNIPHVTFADEEKSNDSDEKLNNSSVAHKNVSSANSIANSKEHESHGHGESNELEQRRETKEPESAGREITIQSRRNGRNGRKLTENEREEEEKDTLISIAQEDIKEIMEEYSNEAKEIELENGLEYVLALFDGHFRFLCPTMGAKEFPWKNWQKNCYKWEALWKPFRNWIQLLAIVNAKQSLDSDVNLMYLTVRPMLKSKNGQNDRNLLVKTIKAFIEIRTNPKDEKGEKKGGFTELEPPEWDNPNEFEYVNGMAEFCKREYSRHKKYSIKDSEQFQEAKAKLRLLLKNDNEVLAGKENKHFDVDHRFRGNLSMPRTSAYNRRLHGPSHGHYNPSRSNYNYPHSHYSAEDHQHHHRSQSSIPHPLHPAKFRPHLYKNQFRQHTTHPAKPPVKKMPSFRHLDDYKQRYLDADHPTMIGPKNGIIVI